MHTEHLRDELLSQRKDIALDTVVNHLEPTTLALIDVMQPIASPCL
jgi:hypothetical protein